MTTIIRVDEKQLAQKKVLQQPVIAIGNRVTDCIDATGEIGRPIKA